MTGMGNRHHVGFAAAMLHSGLMLEQDLIAIQHDATGHH